MGSIATYIADKAAKKKQTPAEWMQSNLQNLERCRAVSHIARYTNPDVAISLHENSNPVGQGFLPTADVIDEEDLVVNGGAAYMAIASFLVGKFSQKETKEEQKKAKKKSDLDSAGRAGAWSGGDFWAVSGAETGNFRK